MSRQGSKSALHSPSLQISLGQLPSRKALIHLSSHLLAPQYLLSVYYVPGTVWVLKAQGGNLTPALLVLSLIGGRRKQNTMTQSLWKDKFFKLPQHIGEIPTFILEGAGGW